MSDSAVRLRRYAASRQAILPLLAAAMIFVPVILAGRSMLNDPDIYWHVVVGRWIAAHHAFPHVDPFSLTMAGQPWIAKEWLSQLIYAGAFGLGGWASVVIVATISIAIAFALLARFLARDLSPQVALVLLMGAMLLTAPHLVARPHVLAMPFMVAWTAGLVSAVDRRRVPTLMLLPLMVIWANLHAGFTLGLALMIPLGIEAVWQAKPAERRRAAISWLRFIVLAIVAACITPYGPQSMMMTARVLGLGPALGIINEWKPQDFSAIKPFEIVLLAGLGLALIRGFKLPPMRLVLVLGLLHMGLSHVRYAEILGLLAPIVMAHPLGAQLRARPEESGGRDFIILPCDVRLIWGAGIVLLAGMSWLAATLGDLKPDRFISPQGAVAAIKSTDLKRVFNDYEFGGYMVAAGLEPFIDGRTELYGGKFTAQHNSAVTLSNLPGFLKILNKDHIQATLLAPSRPAVALLDLLPGWRRLYSDDVAVVHVRTGGLAEPCLQPCAEPNP